MTEREFWQAAWLAARAANWAHGDDGAARSADEAVRLFRARESRSCVSCGRTFGEGGPSECKGRPGVYCMTSADAGLKLPEDDPMSNVPSLPTREQIRAAMDGAAFCAHCGGNHAKGDPHVL